MWKMVLWGATFNAGVVVGMVSLLLFRLPMAFGLWCQKTNKYSEAKVNKSEKTRLQTNYQDSPEILSKVLEWNSYVLEVISDKPEQDQEF